MSAQRTPPPTWRPSPNCDGRELDVDMVVLHYTDMARADRAVDWLCDPAARVSAHYLVAADGAVVQMVDEGMRAWHAGVSFWRGERDNNGRSIGIELASPGHRDGTAPTFSNPQIEALLRLLDAIRGRHTIPPRNVVAHSDIAPHRKLDPGERFPWPRLAREGHAVEAPPCANDAGTVNAVAFAQPLSAIGYAPADKRVEEVFGVMPAPSAMVSAPGAPTVPAVLPAAQDGTLWQAVSDAFHRRFRPDQVGAVANQGSLTLARTIAATLDPNWAERDRT